MVHSSVNGSKNECRESILRLVKNLNSKRPIVSKLICHFSSSSLFLLISATGVNYQGDEEEVLQKIMKMEERDHKNISLTGAHKSS